MREFRFSAVLHHVTEAHLVVEELAAAGVACALGPIAFTRRGRELEKLSLATAGLLEKSGVPLALITDHPTFPSHYLPVLAGMACREGMTRDGALAAVTSVPARLLGVDDEVGSLEPGKRADLVVHAGDPLDVMTRVELVVVGGVRVRPGLPGSNPSLHESLATQASRGGTQPCCS